MGQYARLSWSVVACFAVALASLIVACDRTPQAAGSRPTTRPDKPTVASLVPSITDILLQMGTRDQIVGISNYDPQTPERAGIPRVGDYLSADWEQLTHIRPKVLVIPTQKQEIAGIFVQRAERLGITLVDVHVDRLEEIYPVIRRLGEAADAKPAADELIAAMQAQINAVKQSVAGREKIRTLIVLDETAQFAVGPRNFLDDLLAVAGGKNVAAELEKDYPMIDREKLLALNPDAIIQLLPAAPPQVVDAAKRFWSGVPQLNAVKNGRVYIHSEPYLLLPGPRVTDVGRLIAQDLHLLTASSGPTTTTR